ncbi:hypothetical protein DB346_18820 [Verrucomicrobia bacterium LW23]|nr:hypothetical protein DB346_18820 [Verrucomicrobia bacterium LW23]
MVIELLAALLLGMGVLHRIALGKGWYGPHNDAFAYINPPPPGDATVIGFAVAGGLLMMLGLRGIVWPHFKVEQVSTPRHIGPVSVVVPGDSWSVSTAVITTHPAYVLVDLFAAILPVLLLLASLGMDIDYYPTLYGAWWTLAVLAVFPVARLLCWYVLRRRPHMLEPATRDWSAARVRNLHWHLAWWPVLLLWIIALATGGTGLGVAMVAGARESDETRVKEDFATQFTTPEASDRKRFAVEGRFAGNLHLWPRDVPNRRDQCAAVMVTLPGRSTPCLMLVEGADVKRFCAATGIPPRTGEALAGKEFRAKIRIMRPLPTPEVAETRRRSGNLPWLAEHFYQHYNASPAALGVDPRNPPDGMMVQWVDP